MTSRVYQSQQPALRPTPPRGPRRRQAASSWRPGLRQALVVAIFLVPIAGVSEAPTGLWMAAATAVALLVLDLSAGQRVPWGLLLIVAIAAGLGAPRGPFPGLGPALLVATALSLIFWLAGRRTRRPDDRSRPRPGSPEHAAQLIMGFSGERHVGHVLARDLPEEYALINGLKLPRGAGDIDHLVVGPSGVFVVETKTMAGHIVCDPDGTWKRTRRTPSGGPYDAYIGDPAAQVQRNIFAVRECLRRRAPSLFRTNPLWIEGMVVFPHPRTVLDAGHSRVPALLVDHAAARICMHVPQRWLQPAEIDAVVEALLAEGRLENAMAVRQSAQAVVEIALLLPVMLGLVFGTLAASRLVQAQTAVIALAHEAARAGALGRTSSDAVDLMRGRAQLVAPGLGLDPGRADLQWDVTHFSQDPGEVVALVSYTVDFADLPFVNWMASSMTVRAEHVEWVDPFRSGVQATSGAGVD